MPRQRRHPAQRIEKITSLIIEWGVVSVLFVAPLWVIPISFTRNSAEISIILAIVGVILAATLLRSWALRIIEFRVPWVFIGAISLVAASFASITHAANPRFVLCSILLLCLFVLFGITLSQSAISDVKVKQILAALVAAGAIATLIAILQYIGLLGDPMSSPIDRAISTFGNRNYFGSFIGVVAFPSLALLYSLRHTRIRYFAWPLSALCFLGPFLVQQMGIAIALLVGLVFLVVGIAVFRLGHFVRSNSKAILSLVLAALLGASAGFAIRRASSDSDIPTTSNETQAGLWDSNSGRVREMDWGTAWEMFKANPTTGVGLGNYKVEFLDYKARFVTRFSSDRYLLQAHPAAQAHNDYLQLLAELGIPGVVALLIMVSVILGTSWKRCRSVPDEANRFIFLLLAAGLVVTCTHAMVSFPFHLPVTALAFIAILGVLSSPHFGEQAILRFRIKGAQAQIFAIVGLLFLCLLGGFLSREFAARVVYAQGVAQMEAGDAAQALDLFERSISMGFCPTQARSQLARVAFLNSYRAQQQGNQALAEELLQIGLFNALRCRDQYPTEQSLLLLAGIAMKLEEYAIAEDSISMILASLPRRDTEKDARYLLAALLAQQGDYEEAKQALGDLIEDYPMHVQSYIILGQLLWQEGSMEEGRQTLQLGLQTAERELLRLENDLVLADSMERASFIADQQRLLLERESLKTLLESR